MKPKPAPKETRQTTNVKNCQHQDSQPGPSTEHVHGGQWPTCRLLCYIPPVGGLVAGRRGGAKKETPLGERRPLKNWARDSWPRHEMPSEKNTAGLVIVSRVRHGPRAIPSKPRAFPQWTVWWPGGGGGHNMRTREPLPDLRFLCYIPPVGGLAYLR